MSKLTFAVVGDLHVGATAEEVQTAIRLLNAADPAFVLFLGDLVNKPTEASMDELVAALRRIGPPVYLTIGNHDMARADDGFDVPGRIAAAFPGPWSDSFTYGFTAGQWRFVVGGTSTMSIPYQGPQINHIKGHVSEHGGMIYMPREDLERFIALLEATGEAPACVVLHPPLVPMARRVRERGCFDQVRLLEEPQVLSLIQDRPNVRLCLYGHEHFNQVDAVDGRLHCITQGVRGYGPYGDPSAIRMVELSETGVRSWLTWDDREPEPPAPIGTLAGDRSFEWIFA